MGALCARKGYTMKKTVKIQLNATTFKATRNVISAYFGAKFELAEELDRTKRATKAFSDAIQTDKSQLMALAMGKKEGIIRTESEIRKSLESNVNTYNKLIAPYNAMVEKVSDAIGKAVALFDGKDTPLYRAYCAYVTDTTDDNFNVYATAMSERLVALGLSDATPENVEHFMPNADRELRGKSAVKAGDIQGALSDKNFAHAVLRKIYVSAKASFASEKFAKYVRECAKKAEAK